MRIIIWSKQAVSVTQDIEWKQKAFAQINGHKYALCKLTSLNKGEHSIIYARIIHSIIYKCMKIGRQLRWN